MRKRRHSTLKRELTSIMYIQVYPSTLEVKLEVKREDTCQALDQIREDVTYHKQGEVCDICLWGGCAFVCTVIFTCKVHNKALLTQLDLITHAIVIWSSMFYEQVGQEELDECTLCIFTCRDRRVMIYTEQKHKCKMQGF